jgi:hypothetical protein
LTRAGSAVSGTIQLFVSNSIPFSFAGTIDTAGTLRGEGTFRLVSASPGTYTMELTIPAQGNGSWSMTIVSSTFRTFDSTEELTASMTACSDFYTTCG